MPFLRDFICVKRAGPKKTFGRGRTVLKPKIN